MVPATLARIVPSPSLASQEASCTNRTHIPRTGRKGPCLHTHSHTHDRSSGSQRCNVVLRGPPSGGPCRLDCKEAGLQGRAWLHLQPLSHGRRGGPWAGPGRVVGTVWGTALLASLAGGAWGGSPGTLVRGSWAAHLELASKGCALLWWPWW